MSIFVQITLSVEQEVGLHRLDGHNLDQYSTEVRTSIQWVFLQQLTLKECKLNLY